RSACPSPCGTDESRPAGEADAVAVGWPPSAEAMPLHRLQGSHEAKKSVGLGSSSPVAQTPSPRGAGGEENQASGHEAQVQGSTTSTGSQSQAMNSDGAEVVGSSSLETKDRMEYHFASLKTLMEVNPCCAFVCRVTDIVFLLNYRSAWHPALMMSVTCRTKAQQGCIWVADLFAQIHPSTRLFKRNEK
ncbi:unnamed protein product, partial [Protopolystoma xenopodis]